MSKISVAAACSLVVGILTQAAQADFAGVQFSADMIQSGPQGSSEGKMFVGDNSMRMEMEQGGQKIVQIIDQQRQVQWILYPEQRSYMEQKAPATAGPTAKTGSGDPCAGMPGASCRQLGTETVNGREAVKWEMTFSHQGKTATSSQWIDAERQIPLRTETQDGATTELLILGEEELGGRTVEKWEMRMSRPGQDPQSSFQWYDPELKIAIREEFPGGYIRELVNIEQGAQPSDLFTIPAGFSRISMQDMGGSSR
jgi:outer membrane lipoprotein-sorting protein